MTEVEFADLEDGKQFIGVWEHQGEIWCSTYVKSGQSVLEYTMYDENGDLVDDFIDDPGSDPDRIFSKGTFKAYIL